LAGLVVAAGVEEAGAGVLVELVAPEELGEDDGVVEDVDDDEETVLLDDERASLR
jgi:hypothetical protein